MSLKVYYDLMSQPSRALVLFLKLNKIPFEPCVIALRKGEHLTEEYIKVNRFKKVPAISHNGFTLTESIAIIRYLAREFPIEDKWYPKESKKRAKVDEFLEWQHLSLRLNGSMVFQTKVIQPLLTQEPVNEKRLQTFLGHLQTTLDSMEEGFLKGNKFINGPTISAADLFGACEVEQPIASGYDITEPRPLLKAWLERVKKEVGPLYEETHAVCYKVRDVFKKAKL